MYHPQRRKVTISMVGLTNGHIRKNLTQNGEPQRYSWEGKRRMVKPTDTAGKAEEEEEFWLRGGQGSSSIASFAVNGCAWHHGCDGSSYQTELQATFDGVCKNYGSMIDFCVTPTGSKPLHCTCECLCFHCQTADGDSEDAIAIVYGSSVLLDTEPSPRLVSVLGLSRGSEQLSR